MRRYLADGGMNGRVEMAMRPSTANETQTRNLLAIPRGWVIVSAAAASWLILLTMWFAASSLFSFVISNF